MASHVASSNSLLPNTFTVDFSQALSEKPMNWDPCTVWSASSVADPLLECNLPPQKLLVKSEGITGGVERLMFLAICANPSASLILKFGMEYEAVKHEAQLYQVLKNLQGREVARSHGILTRRQQDGNVMYCLVLQMAAGDPVSHGEGLGWYKHLAVPEK